MYVLGRAMIFWPQSRGGDRPPRPSRGSAAAHR